MLQGTSLAKRLDIRRYLLKKKIDRYSPTLPSLPTVPVAVVTDKIQAVDKTKTFCSMINMLIRNHFACVTVRFGQDDYSVVHVHETGKEIQVYFQDYGGAIWSTLVSEWNSFQVFRGV